MELFARFDWWLLQAISEGRPVPCEEDRANNTPDGIGASSGYEVTRQFLL